jgi:hypothetical protein
MFKDKDGNIIGVGETTAISILNDVFKDSTKIIPQYPLIKLLADDYIDSLAESYLKHKVDIMIFTADKKIVVRVQGKDHDGVLKSARDTVQKKLMEWNDCIVVDLTWQECPYLFKEQKDENSYLEVMNAFKSSGLNIT